MRLRDVEMGAAGIPSEYTIKGARCNSMNEKVQSLSIGSLFLTTVCIVIYCGPSQYLQQKTTHDHYQETIGGSFVPRMWKQGWFNYHEWMDSVAETRKKQKQQKQQGVIS